MEHHSFIGFGLLFDCWQLVCVDDGPILCAFDLNLYRFYWRPVNESSPEQGEGPRGASRASVEVVPRSSPKKRCTGSCFDFERDLGQPLARGGCARIGLGSIIELVGRALGPEQGFEIDLGDLSPFIGVDAFEILPLGSLHRLAAFEGREVGGLR